MAYKYIWKITLSSEEQREPFIANWLEPSIVLQEYPGALGTRLHVSVDDPLTLYASAEWESKSDRDAMEAARVAGSERGKRWEKFAKNDSFGAVEPVARPQLIETVLPK